MRGSHRSGGVVARAPGKVNVCFRVGDEQADTSHVIATLYQAVSLFDTVYAYPDSSFTLEMLGGHTEIPGGERNLAMRAAKLLANTTGYRGGVHLEIEKRIPRGAGMSGGSADAAAALVACNELWGLGLDRFQLKELAAGLGADVPFALEGGTAVGTGHGDEYSQALSVGTYHWVIIPSIDRLSEDDVVMTLDEHRTAHQADLGVTPQTPAVDMAVLHAVRSGCARTLAEVLHNDLQMAALKLSRDAMMHLEKGETVGALAGITLATTSTVMLLAEDKLTAQRIQAAFEADGCEAIVVEGPVAGAQVIERALPMPLALR